MNQKKLSGKTGPATFALGAVLLGTLTGCVGYVDGPRHERAYVAPEPAVVFVQDDYVYYPSYQVYFSSSRHQYIYLEGRSWVTRPAPPRVSVDVLFASPSVNVDFHDSPARHHAEIVRQYPRNWAPAGSHQEQKKDRKNDKRDQSRDKKEHDENNGR